MACTQEVMVGRTRQQQIDQVFHGVCSGNRRTQDALGSGGLAIFDEEAKPMLKLFFVGKLYCGQWTQHATRWTSKGIACTVDEAVDISQSLVIFPQMLHEQSHARQDGQPHREAPLAEAQPMHRGCTEDVTVRDSVGTQTCYRLGNQEGIAFLHALAQITQELFGPATHIALQGRWTDPDLAVANL